MFLCLWYSQTLLESWDSFHFNHKPYCLMKLHMYHLDIQQIPASLHIHINSYSLFPICFKRLYMGPMKTSLNLFCLLPLTPCSVTFSLLSLKTVRIRAKRMIQKQHQWLLKAQWQYWQVIHLIHWYCTPIKWCELFNGRTEAVSPEILKSHDST